ncbi:MAG: HEAT repeat domain-containing protein, partial [Candidatus Promineifilaceae bacterium]|nr:HEAT repeat domain-containing protein [Candidatus Promineifilaceae bacterium]
MMRTEREQQKSFGEVLGELFHDEEVSLTLLFHLTDMSPEQHEQFCQAWPEVDEERRRVIARHLADISEENFEVDFSPVFAFCLADVAEDVRLASLDGLWDTDRVSLIGPIVRLMEGDSSTRVRALAAATLGHYVLMAEWGQIPQQPVTPAVDALLAQLDDVDSADMVKRAALESVGAATHERVRPLIDDAYRRGDREMRKSAVFAMGRSADPHWLPIIREEMYSESKEMRMEAARAAGEIADSSAVPELAGLLEDGELEVVLAAVYALGQIGDSRAQRLLAEMTEELPPGVVLDAVDEALEELSWLGGEIDL